MDAYTSRFTLSITPAEAEAIAAALASQREFMSEQIESIDDRDEWEKVEMLDAAIERLNRIVKATLANDIKALLDSFDSFTATDKSEVLMFTDLVF